MQKSMYRDTPNVEYQMCDTGNNWSHRYGIERFNEKSEAIPGKHTIDSPQQTAILGTSHILVLWKALQCETWKLCGEDYRWLKMRSTGEKKLVTRDDDDDDDEHGHVCRFPKSLGTSSISVISIVLIWALCN